MNSLLSRLDIDLNLKQLLADALAFVQNNVLTWSVLVQAVILAICLLLGRLAAGRLSAWLLSLAQRPRISFLGPFIERLAGHVSTILAIALLGVGLVVAGEIDLPVGLLNLAWHLLAAWVLISLVTSFIADTFLSRLIGLAIWTWAALSIAGVWAEFTTLLDGWAVTVGEVRISVFLVLKGLVLLLGLIKVAGWIADLVENRIQSVEGLTPSSRVLIGKLIKITLVALAMLMVLQALGIKLTALAVFGGAVGVGIGFGLQKVVGNFLSGIILLMDKSIKPGDVIEVEGVYGWITEMRARYSSVVTRDNMNYLIPNEDLITQRVINWSFTDTTIRQKVEVGVSYESDVEKAMELMLEAARDVERCIDDPEPRVMLKEFGNSSVNLELRFWVSDPQNGLMNVKSAIRLNIWRLFHEHGITIPFPQRDVHLDIASKEQLEKLAGLAGLGRTAEKAQGNAAGKDEGEES